MSMHLNLPSVVKPFASTIVHTWATSRTLLGIGSNPKVCSLVTIKKILFTVIV